MARASDIVRPLALLAALTLGLAAAPVADAKRPRAVKVRNCAHADALPSTASTSELAAAAVCLVNNERAKRRMRRLRPNRRLSAAARRHNADMLAQNYFEHVSPNGFDVVDRLLKSKYLARAARWVVGENLAWGAEELGSPREITRAWMASRGHRRNILNRRFREIGIAVSEGAPAYDGPNSSTYTTTFGTRR